VLSIGFVFIVVLFPAGALPRLVPDGGLGSGRPVLELVLLEVVRGFEEVAPFASSPNLTDGGGLDGGLIIAESGVQSKRLWFKRPSDPVVVVMGVRSEQFQQSLSKEEDG